MSVPSFLWGELSGQDCAKQLIECYNEALHWRRNLFKVPQGKAGNEFVQEISRLFRSYAEASSLESIALTATILFPILVLQKPHSQSTSKDLVLHMTRRIKLWTAGSFPSLMNECRSIQHCFPSNKSAKHQFSLEESFNSLMLEGRVREAIRLLSEDTSGGLLDLDSPAFPNNPSAGSVWDQLLLKHPPQCPPDPTTVLLPTTPPLDHDPHPVIYEKINASLIKTMALRTFGSGGPSGLDSSAWRHICSSFRQYSEELCSSMAAATRCICSSYVDPQGLQAFLSCRLIALSKNPMVRPIAIGETCRRIVCKSVIVVLHLDVMDVTGSVQLCAGQKGGCEAAVHTMRFLFNPDLLRLSSWLTQPMPSIL